MPLHQVFRLCTALFFVVTLSSCDSGTEWKSGDYKVYWIDVPTELVLGRDIGDENSIGRVMARVSRVGENSKWIVAARHQTTDSSIIEYFYFSKDSDTRYLNADEIVKGPFTGEQFRKEGARLGLPEFSVFF